MIMGNCIRKKTQDPNRPQTEPAHPPTGIDAIRNSRSTTSSAQQQTLSGPSKSSKARPCKTELCEVSRPERDRHVSISNSRRDKHRKNKKHGSPTTPRDWSVSNVKKVGWVPARNINSFCYSVLRAATQKFSDRNLIGEGGFGNVYIGYINPSNMHAAKPDADKAVAIKTLRRGIQSDEEWQNELRFLSTLNHPNVVKLTGYCYARDHRILVYEYMWKGSLDAHLLNENDTELNWSRRIKVAIGAARAVDYLHARPRPVIHRDLKASNVLLDADFNPRPSDFGLARYGSLDDQSHISTRILGTRGYFAREYFKTGHSTLKSDVYSFGVVLLEIFSGCVAVKRYPDGTTMDLPIWDKQHQSNQMELHNIIDKRISRNIEMEEAYRFASIIRHCLSSDPRDRPTMAEILANTKQLQQDLLLCNLITLGQSKYHRRVQIL